MKNLPAIFIVGVLFLSLAWPLLNINMVEGLPPRSIKIRDSVTGLNSTTVGNSSLHLPPGGIPFTMNVSLIGQTTDLASWQVGITFDNNSLRCTNLSISESDPNYVFRGLSEIKVIDFSAAAQNGSYSGGIPEIIAGAALLDPNNAVSVNNSLLCTMNFTAFNVVKGGKTTISFWPYPPATDTFLWDKNGVDIPFANESFTVNILSIDTETYNLTLSTVGQGTVNLNSTGPYNYSDAVQLTAVPSSGWSFDHWSGNLSGNTNPATLVMTSNMSVTATFTQNAYFLNINTSGNGTVNLNNSGPYYFGDAVQLTAVPSTGWSFSNWSGDLNGSANPATIIVNGNKTVTATFAQNVYTLTVTISGSGNVARNNSGPYHYNDVVQLTATPSIGWNFDHWSGNLTGPGNPTSIVLVRNEVVTATFNRSMYAFSVNVIGNGAVNLNNSGPYYYGDVVELTATPGTGWNFAGWSGDLIGSMNPTTILIDGNKSLTSTFTPNTYTLSTSIVGVGAVNRNNTGPYYYGDVVELTAVPSSDWSFKNWSGDLLGSTNPATILIDGNKTVTAYFTPTHDVAVTNVVITKTIVGQGYTVNITVTAQNLGSVAEDFNVTVYANTSMATTITFSLMSGDSQTATSFWNTTGFAYGNYTLLGVGDLVPGDVNPSNNNFTCLVLVHVGVPGDVSSPIQGIYDGSCNMRDVQYLILHFNTNPSSPNWNPNADINNDSTVNMRDIQIAILNFNKRE